VQQWLGTYFGTTVTGEVSGVELALATQAAQWGADQELEACCLLLDNGEHAASYGCHNGTSLRAARRPKPPSLKEQALEGFERVLSQLYSPEARKGLEAECKTIRRALEALDD
jgi:predicted HD phosphohydrolase